MAPPPRLTLDATPGIAPADHQVAGWIEWVSPDGGSVVIELANAVEPAAGRIWWVRDDDLKPVAILAIQPRRRGVRIGAIVTRGAARVGAEVVSDEPARAPRFPTLQAGSSK